jgi:hypothetical protein
MSSEGVSALLDCRHRTASVYDLRCFLERVFLNTEVSRVFHLFDDIVKSYYTLDFDETFV